MNDMCSIDQRIPLRVKVHVGAHLSSRFVSLRRHSADDCDEVLKLFRVAGHLDERLGDRCDVVGHSLQHREALRVDAL